MNEAMKALEALREEADDPLLRGACVRALTRLAALPQREPVPAAPHEGEPPDWYDTAAWRAYARRQRERAERAERDAELAGDLMEKAQHAETEAVARAEAAQRGCEREHGKRKAAEAELAKLREVEPVAKVHNGSPGDIAWLCGEGEPLDGDLLYTAPVPPADHAQALRAARAEVWREAAEIAFEAGAPRLQGQFAAKAREVKA